MKRFSDVVLATLLIVVTCVPMIMIAVWIKYDSPGPIIFKQKRAGQHHQNFYIWKFRTMYINTPNVATDALANHAQYITPSGRFLRKTSLDELPQLINIIRGDMSFVGPRPALYNQYELIEMREMCNIESVKPGLTGYAQINGRDFITDEQKVYYDQYYVEHRGWRLDCYIMFHTFIRVLATRDIKS